MKAIKLISIFLLVLIAITNSNCGDCDDEDDIRNQEQNKTTVVHKDSLKVN